MKFMAMPHYTYVVLKMPMEQGVLSLRANLNVAYSYKKECFSLVEATDISICMQDCLMSSQQISPQDLEIPTMQATRASTKSKEVKEVVLVPSDQSKIVQIRADLNPK